MFYADLHIHSPYAAKCSKAINFKELTKWAKQKGISLLGTGDCFHPVWKLKIAELSSDEEVGLLYYGSDQSVYYIPTVEVNCKDLRRETHMLIVFPDMKAAGQVEKKLAKYGEFRLKGRPDVKLTPGQLMDVVKSEFNDAIVIAAHILTPWFGMYGARNNIESFEDVMDTPPDAIESGLSADWRMVGAIKELGDVPIVSFSDAHSMPNIGREVTMFYGDPFQKNILSSLRSKQLKTLEFPPALGKYHYSGHRACGYSVGLTRDLICPKCFKVVTKGVEERLTEFELQWPVHKESYLFPLVQLIALAINSVPRADDTVKIYWEMTNISPEIELLTRFNLDHVKNRDIRNVMQEARDGQLKVIPGYDGNFGEIKSLYPLLMKNMEKSNDLFMDKKEHKAFWDRANQVSELMNNGDMTITKDAYEALCRRPV